MDGQERNSLLKMEIINEKKKDKRNTYVQLKRKENLYIIIVNIN